ncbi:unnamed protein product [Paramecium sonneborni]|uniref:G domain-containing protein n=1 Tax=Paramecium sonneborni TaxID=65129 RepID=A0A8S1KJV9_9CILI|nr:unnamed protein product [Paramecium sonneborni]
MDQNQPPRDQQIQDRLLNAIDMVEKQLGNITTNNLNNIIILIGKTGSGKSTIFNFLCGAKFQIIQDQDEKEVLDLLVESDQFQKMKGGLDSTTKFPKIYYSQQYQHSIIDYPGFNDTEKKDQLEIQLLFNKIVTIHQIKIAYVIYNAIDQFQNKAEDLQEFIRETEIDLSKLTVIINGYCKNRSDEKLIADFQQQLKQKFQKSALKMIIQRDADTQEKIEKYFSEESRNKLWLNLVQSEVIQMKRYELNAYKDADYYISKKSYEIQKILIDYIDKQKIKQYTIFQLEEFKKNIEELDKKKTTLKSFIDGNINVLNQIMNYCDQFNEDEIIATQRIYLFFLDSENEFRQMDNYIRDVYKNLVLCIEFLNIKLQFLEELRKAEDRILQIQEEKKTMKNEKREVEDNLKKVQNELKLKNDELINTKENFQNQIFELRKIKDETQLILNGQLNENKNLQEIIIKLEQELVIQKENEKMLNEIRLEKQELNHKIQEQLMIIQDLKSEQQRLDQKNKEIEKQYSNNVEKLENSLDSTIEELKEFKKINMEIQEEKRKLEDQLSIVKGQHKEIESDLKISRKEFDQQKEEFQLLKNISNTQIQRQSQEIDDLNQQIQKLKQEKEQLSKQMKKQEDEYYVEKKQFRDNDFQLQKSLQNVQQKNEELQKELNSKTRDLNSRNNEFQDLKKQFSNSQNELKTKIDEVKHLENKLKTTEEQNRDQLNKSNSLLEKTKRDNEEYKRLKEQEIQQIKLRSLQIRFQLLENNSIKQQNPCYAVAINKDNSIVIASSGNLINVYDLKYGKLNKRQALDQHKDLVYTLNFMKQSNMFISGSHDQLIIVWQMNQDKQWTYQQKIFGHYGSIRCILLNNEEDLIISGSVDGSIKFWEKQSKWTIQQTITEHTDYVYQLCLNEKQDKLISCSDDSQIFIIQQNYDKKWIVKQKITVDKYGYRLCFINNNQFTFQPYAQEQLHIYEINDSKTIKIKSLNIKCGSLSCDDLFPSKYIQSKSLLVNKNGQYINLIRKKENGEFFVEQTIEFDDDSVYGSISDDGQYLITWDNATQEIQIRNSQEL